MGGITNTRPFGNFLVLKKILAHQDRLLKKSSKISVLVYFKSVISHPLTALVPGESQEYFLGSGMISGKNVK